MIEETADGEFWGEPYEILPERPITLNELEASFTSEYEVYIPRKPEQTDDTVVRTSDRMTRSEYQLKADEEMLRFAFRCPEGSPSEEITHENAEWRYMEFGMDLAAIDRPSREAVFSLILEESNLPLTRLR